MFVFDVFISFNEIVFIFRVNITSFIFVLYLMRSCNSVCFVKERI